MLKAITGTDLASRLRLRRPERHVRALRPQRRRHVGAKRFAGLRARRAQLDPRLRGTSKVPEYMIQNSTNYMIQNSTTYRIITDQLGSVRLVVNASTGAIAQRIDYDEFGVVTSDTNPGFQPFGFAGGLYDSDTGLVRFGARDYDPETGRWTTKDPIGFAGRVTNLYEYVINDPVQFGDPDGLQLILIGDLPPLPPWAVPLLGERPPYPGWMKNLAPSNRYNPTGKFPTPTPPPPVDFCPQLPPNLTTGMKPTSTIWDVIFKIWQVAITIGESIGGPGEAPMIIPVTTEPGPIFVGPGMGAA